MCLHKKTDLYVHILVVYFKGFYLTEKCIQFKITHNFLLPENKYTTSEKKFYQIKIFLN